MVITGTFQSSLSRLVDEGRRQSVMEDYQAKKILTVLNSKIDFIQPMRTQLTTITKAVNYAPGKTDNNVPRYPLHPPKPSIKVQRKELKGRRRSKNQGNQLDFTPKLTSTPEK